MGKRIVTYNEYGLLLDKLVEKLKATDIDYIYGIPRGGLPIAVHLSHFLEKPLITKRSDLYWMYIDKNVLLVDDIVDIGKTVTDITNVITPTTHVKIATLFKRPNIDFVDFFVETTGDWIVFPWEKIDEKPSIYHQDVYSDLFKEEKMNRDICRCDGFEVTEIGPMKCGIKPCLRRDNCLRFTDRKNSGSGGMARGLCGWYKLPNGEYEFFDNMIERGNL